MITLLYPENGAKISIHTDWQKEFYRRQYTGIHKDSAIFEQYDAYLSEDGISSCPKTLVFKWKRSDIYTLMKFKISTSPDFPKQDGVETCCTVGKVFASCEDDGVYCVCVTNLKSGTKYYWCVDDGSGAYPINTFTTNENETRFIKVPGSHDNIRDIGGKLTKSGKRVKQGFVFRGAAMEVPYYDHEGLTSEGKHIVRDVFKMKTQIDLRYEAMGKMTDTVFGKDAKYILYPYNPYEGITDPGMQDMNAKILELFADESNYPIFFHCVAGADRTGTLAMLIEGLLGMSDEDIIADYNTTSLVGDIRDWESNEEIKKMMNALNNLYPEKSIQEQLELYVLNCGISSENIEKIKDLLLE